MSVLGESGYYGEKGARECVCGGWGEEQNEVSTRRKNKLSKKINKIIREHSGDMIYIYIIIH